MFVQSHTPFADMVHQPTSYPSSADSEADQTPLKNKCILVLGGDGDLCRKVAQSYGFTNVITPSDLLVPNPSLWPFTNPHTHQQHARPLPLPFLGPSDPEKRLRIHSVFVFADPRDWALDTQVLIDVLTSDNGLFGTRLSLEEMKTKPQVPLYFSNPDLLWSSDYPIPRLGQGGFFAAFKGVWDAVTNGAPLQHTTIGKPSQLTFEFAEKRLNQRRRELLTTKSDITEPKEAAEQGLRQVYMIGDNPNSDIAGGNSYNSPYGSKWDTILVRTGVWSDPQGEPAHKPTKIEDSVWDAVAWALRREGWAGSEDNKLQAQSKQHKADWSHVVWDPRAMSLEMGEETDIKG
ncbi:MAG: hypothetical protein Q9174_003035 [Haloplaca sp. 1 TL-2023]